MGGEQIFYIHFNSDETVLSHALYRKHHRTAVRCLIGHPGELEAHSGRSNQPPGPRSPVPLAPGRHPQRYHLLMRDADPWNSGAKQAPDPRSLNFKEHQASWEMDETGRFPGRIPRISDSAGAECCRAAVTNDHKVGGLK